nr:MAG TPA: hypothetical protein [Caudoviricetes sp.]
MYANNTLSVNNPITATKQLSGIHKALTRTVSKILVF